MVEYKLEEKRVLYGEKIELPKDVKILKITPVNNVNLGPIGYEISYLRKIKKGE